MYLKQFPLSLISAFLCLNSASYSQVWLAKNAEAKFFSATPVENIEGKSNSATAALNSQTKKLLFKIQNKSFKFDKKLMEEHFHENYMESAKYATSDFEGEIVQMPLLEKEGTYEIKAKGILSIHGIKKNVEIPATLIITKENLQGKCSFKVKCADFGIKIPKLVVKNIAEEVEVTILAEFKPYKK